MARGGKGKSYTTEFKYSAIELALRGEQLVTEIASNLGMSAKILHNWLREERIKSGDSSERKLSRQESFEDELK